MKHHHCRSKHILLKLKELCSISLQEGTIHGVVVGNDKLDQLELLEKFHVQIWVNCIQRSHTLHPVGRNFPAVNCTRYLCEDDLKIKLFGWTLKLDTVYVWSNSNLASYAAKYVAGTTTWYQTPDKETKQFICVVDGICHGHIQAIIRRPKKQTKSNNQLHIC